MQRIQAVPDSISGQPKLYYEIFIEDQYTEIDTAFEDLEPLYDSMHAECVWLCPLAHVWEWLDTRCGGYYYFRQQQNGTYWDQYITGKTKDRDKRLSVLFATERDAILFECVWG